MCNTRESFIVTCVEHTSSRNMTSQLNKQYRANLEQAEREFCYIERNADTAVLLFLLDFEKHFISNHTICEPHTIILDDSGVLSSIPNNIIQYAFCSKTEYGIKLKLHKMAM